jgi:NADPH:quinone reductase-like Zn-dependent oxidoreductase
MKAIVVTDQAAGRAGVKLVERPEPQAAINDVVVQIHASGFTGDELTWPSTWTDRAGRDRTPSIPGHELAGVVTALGYGTTGLSIGQRVFGLTDWYRDGTLAEYVAVEARNLTPLPGDVDFTVGAALVMPGLAGAVRARSPSCGAERPRARCGRRSRFDGEPVRTCGRRVRHRHRARWRPSDGSRLRRTRVR